MSHLSTRPRRRSRDAGLPHHARAKRLALLVCLAVALGSLVFVSPTLRRASAVDDTPKAKFRRSKSAIRNQYIVVLKKGTRGDEVEGTATDLVRGRGGRVRHLYKHALRGFSVRMTEAQAVALSRSPRVEFVEEDVRVFPTDIQYNAVWGLDRIDQHASQLNTTYHYNRTAENVNVYVLDTGVRLTHKQFEGRAVKGFDAVDDDNDDSTDTNTDHPNGADGLDPCHGHGTHVAGTVGGLSYGVAKKAKLYSVRVLSGRSPTVCKDAVEESGEALLAGINWVVANHQKPAVVNMSLSSGASDSVDLAVRNLIAAGVTAVVAAGNDNCDAGLYSPARVAEAVTVGALRKLDDARPTTWACASNDSSPKPCGTATCGSNYGSVVDLFAPGEGIKSAGIETDKAIINRSGTSMAAPHVAGVAALYLSAYPDASPEQVQQALINNSVPDKVIDPGEGSPNHLLNANFLSHLKLSTATALGGCAQATGTAVLNVPAKPGGAEVLLSTDNPAVTVPPSVVVPEGETKVSFPVNTSVVPALKVVAIKAAYTGADMANYLTLNPVRIKSLALSPAEVLGGITVNATVTLECAPSSGEVAVTLGSTNTAAAKPAVPGFIIPAGAQSGSFSVNTKKVPAHTSALIQARAGGKTRSTGLNVNAQHPELDVSPLPNAGNVPTTASVSVTFKQDMNAATINAATFRVWGSLTGLRGGAVAYDPATRRATFTPSQPFAHGETVSLTLSRGIALAGGQHLRGFVSNFNVRTLPSSGQFERSAEWEGGGYAILPADFDGDGDVDLAAVQSGAVTIWKNDGGGAFAKHGDFPVTTFSPFSRSSGAADLDNDGDVDLVVATGGSIAVLKNDGDGTFQTPSYYPAQAGGGSSTVAVADFDGDGDLDVASVGGKWVTVFGNDGGGAFDVALSPHAYDVPEYNAVITAADMDEDGDVDIATGSDAAGISQAATLRNNGDGSLQLDAVFRTGNYQHDFLSADMDGDRDVDLIQVGGSGRHDGAIIANDGLGVFGAANGYSVWADLGLTGDFDGDGSTNLAVVDVLSSLSYGRPPMLWIMYPHRSQPLDRAPHALAAADLDGDGDLDMIGLTRDSVGSNLIFILTNVNSP